jgi:hypothetical protein
MEEAKDDSGYTVTIHRFIDTQVKEKESLFDSCRYLGDDSLLAQITIEPNHPLTRVCAKSLAFDKCSIGLRLGLGVRSNAAYCAWVLNPLCVLAFDMCFRTRRPISSTARRVDNTAITRIHRNHVLRSQVDPPIASIRPLLDPIICSSTAILSSLHTVRFSYTSLCDNAEF